MRGDGAAKAKDDSGSRGNSSGSADTAKGAANARSGVYFYSMTVRDGVVLSVKERQIHPAC